MAKEELKRVEKPAESGEVSTSNEAEIKPLSPEKAPTLGKTYTEEEFQKAQSAWGKQVTLSKSEVNKAKADAERYKAEVELTKVEIKELQAEFNKLVEGIEDPDEKKNLLSRISLARERQALAREKAEAETKRYEAEKLAWSVRMAQKAQEVVKETGIDIAQLEDCQTEEEMELKGLKFQLSHKKEPEPEPSEVKTPKFDSAVPSGGGKVYKSGEFLKEIDPRTMTPQQIHAKVQEFEKAVKEGRIKD